MTTAPVPRATGYFEADLGEMLEFRRRRRAPPLLPAVPSRLLHSAAGGHDQLPGSGASSGEAVRGEGGAGPIQRCIREGLSQAGPSTGRRHRRRSVTRPPRSPYPSLPVALRALRRGPGTASCERPDGTKTTVCGSRSATTWRTGCKAAASSPPVPPATTTT